MAKESSISVDLDDPRIGMIADVISNKTSKKILMLLADGEISEGDISAKLGLPINTIEYNLKKLIEAGLVDKSSKFFWSVKGKKIPLYRVSNKKIVISPKSSSTGILGALVVSGLVAFGIWLYSSSSSVIQTASDASTSGGESFVAVLKGASQAASAPVVSTASIVSSSSGIGTWLWFLLGSLVAVFVIILSKMISERRSI